MTPPVLEVEGAVRTFDLSRGPLERLGILPSRRVHAVDGVTFSLSAGRTFGIVGESGSGKSTLGRMIVGLTRPSAGVVRIEGKDIHARGGAARPHTGRVQMVFQDPYSSLNARRSVHDAIGEALIRRAAATGRRLTRADVASAVGQSLAAVGLEPSDARRYPHAFSGGQRQRVSIARALASSPALIVCDEPTSALDVSVQAQILNLMKDIQERLGLAIVFISHDLAIVAHMADEVGVLYLGRFVETGPAQDVLSAPVHPYTRLLISAVPSLKPRERRSPRGEGEIASPANRPSGCHFHPRCPFANERCRKEEPRLAAHAGREVACHAAEEGRLPVTA